MFDNIFKFFKKLGKKEPEELNSKDMAKERLHLVLMQDRANVSADFLDMMKQEIIDVIKKYIDVDEQEIDVRLTNKMNEDGTTGAPALYANIPIAGIKSELQTTDNVLVTEKKEESDKEEKVKEDEGNKKPEDSSKNSNEEDNKEDDIEENEGEEVIIDKDEEDSEESNAENEDIISEDKKKEIIEDSSAKTNNSKDKSKSSPKA